MTRIGELGTTLAVTSNRSTLRRNAYHLDYGSDTFPPKLWSLQEPHGVTSQKTAFSIVTAVKTSNLTVHAVFVAYQYSGDGKPVGESTQLFISQTEQVHEAFGCYAEVIGTDSNAITCEISLDTVINGSDIVDRHTTARM
jgi:hypothetical protein